MKRYLAMVALVAAVVSLVLAGPEWREDDDGGEDAGPAPGSAQTTSGDGTFGAISGQLGGLGLSSGGVGFAGGEALDFDDLYLICIDDPENFRASTADGAGFSEFNSRLFLFDVNAFGLVGNILAASDPDSPFTGAVLEDIATDESGAQVIATGVYYLGITVNPREPLGPSGLPIFFFEDPMEISGPDGPGGGEPIVDWTGEVPGACCSPGGSCVDVTEPECAEIGGIFQGFGTECLKIEYARSTADTPFEDISDTGTRLILGDDDGVIADIGFPFTFYDNEYTEVGISSNGYLSFGDNLTDASPDPIPNPASPNDLIAPYWTDLDPSAGGAVYVEAQADRLIVQWSDVPLFADEATSTFQVVLLDDNNIEFHYDGVAPASIAAGVENDTGTLGEDVAGAVPGDIRLTRNFVGGTVACDVLVTGACILEGGCIVTTQLECEGAGGAYGGDGTDCEPAWTGAAASRDPGGLIELANENGTAAGTTMELDGEYRIVLDGVCFASNVPVGACLLPDGLCVVVTEFDCIELQGTYQGDDSMCPTGACILPDLHCVIVTEFECVDQGGDYLGDDSACPTGACSFPDGSCDIVMQGDCLDGGGMYLGDDSMCPTGACTLPDTICIVTTFNDCLAQSGTYQGDDTPCPTGGCTLPDGVCVIATQLDCVTTLAGVYLGDGVACPTGGCVLPDGVCIVVTQLDCNGQSGMYLGDDVPCPTGACVLSDESCLIVTQLACIDAGGNYLGDDSECPIPVMGAYIDIKPGSCPNSWNRDSNGNLPVSLLGTSDLDVLDVDISTVRLSRADGFGGSQPPNPGSPGSSYGDTGTPYLGMLCSCHEEGGDGELDLNLKFRTSNLVKTLQMDEFPAGDIVELVLTGELSDGTAFEARDCVRLVPPNTPQSMVTVQTLPGRFVDVSPVDDYMNGGGYGTFERAYYIGTELFLTAESVQDAEFIGWIVDGEVVQYDDPNLHVVLTSATQQIRAFYRQRDTVGDSGTSDPNNLLDR